MGKGSHFGSSQSVKLGNNDDLSKTVSAEKRPAIPERVKIMVWARSAGRCNFCNRLVTMNDDLGEPVSIGELAHNVGWSDNSPRGDDPLEGEQRQEPENLVLACRNCHKPIDDGGVVGRYTVEELKKHKIEHEKRIERLTAIGADKAAYIIRVVGDVRGVSPELKRETVLTATTAQGLYPHVLPGSHWEDIDLDLRGRGDLNTTAEYESMMPEIKRFAAKVHDGVRRDDTARLAVFGFARIPLLVALGAELDDKVPAVIFQRQRIDNENAWAWQNNGETAKFEVAEVQTGTDPHSVALVMNLSGTIYGKDLPADITSAHHVYTLSPTTPATTGPTLITNTATLANLEATLRSFLAMVEARHGKLPTINLFGAIPIAAAVTVGRVLMPNVSPAWCVYDRDADGKFFMALEVRR